MSSLRDLQEVLRRTLAGWRWDLTLFVCSVVTLGILVVSETGHSKLEQEHSKAMEGVRVYAKLGRLARRLADAETAQRGYLLTRSESYLDPYREALPEITTLLEQLETYFTNTGSSLDAERMRLIKNEAARKVAEMEKTLFAARQATGKVRSDWSRRTSASTAWMPSASSWRNCRWPRTTGSATG